MARFQSSALRRICWCQSLAQRVGSDNGIGDGAAVAVAGIVVGGAIACCSTDAWRIMVSFLRSCRGESVMRATGGETGRAVARVVAGVIAGAVAGWAAAG